MTPIITTGMCTLRILINEHHQLLLKEYNIELIPKHHLIIHYPRIINQMGPVVQYWTMWFETRHGFFLKLGFKINEF